MPIVSYVRLYESPIRPPTSTGRCNPAGFYTEQSITSRRLYAVFRRLIDLTTQRGFGAGFSILQLQNKTHGYEMRCVIKIPIPSQSIASSPLEITLRPNPRNGIGYPCLYSDSLDLPTLRFHAKTHHGHLTVNSIGEYNCITLNLQRQHLYRIGAHKTSTAYLPQSPRVHHFEDDARHPERM